MKKNCLMLLGSAIASYIDHLIGGLQTPAIIDAKKTVQYTSSTQSLLNY